MNTFTVRAERVESAPENLADFIDEISSGLSELYGPEAGTNYLRVAPSALRASFAYPSVTAVSVRPVVSAEAGSEEYSAGLAVAVTRSAIAQISLIHVLRRALGQDLEGVLIQGIVGLLRGEQVEGIVCEAVPMVPLHLDRPFAGLGFQRIERVLMITNLTENGLARPHLRESRPLTQKDIPALAEVIVDTYRDHPGHALHAEVRTREGAATFLEIALAGGFGGTRPAFSRVIVRNGQIVAGIVGSEVAPKVGFILQLVVAPAWQHQGLGTMLMGEAAQCFRESGYSRLALGVTADNPARGLYERLGFRTHRNVNAYVWWRSSP